VAGFLHVNAEEEEEVNIEECVERGVGTFRQMTLTLDTPANGARFVSTQNEQAVTGSGSRDSVRITCGQTCTK